MAIPARISRRVRRAARFKSRSGKPFRSQNA